jgi:very-short-patch-repair endonuclease
MRRDVAKARELRRTATEAEHVAWRLLRSLRHSGLKFRRQHPVRGWVADFCCPQRGLVVELDGSVHGQPSQARRDAARDRALRRVGYTVLRLPNGIVFEDPDAFVRKVVERGKALPNFFTGELPPPHPRPPLPTRGRGEKKSVKGRPSPHEGRGDKEFES